MNLFTNELKTIINKAGLFLFLVMFISSCTIPKVPFHPHVSYTPPLCHLKHKASPFKPLSPEELQEDFGKEMKIAKAFACEHDFYRSITGYKRALILVPTDNAYRITEIEYSIILSYYLAQKYEDVLQTFEASYLKSHICATFPALHDLLIILYESCNKTCNKESAAHILKWIDQIYPKTAGNLKISDEVASGNLGKASTLPGAPPFFCGLYRGYLNDMKSKRTAEMLNTVLPGAGYWYVGQKNTAITAFIVNALFIAAAYQFFHKGYVAAGIITASLEGGWYIGGIYGGGRAAAEYNEHKYEEYGRKALDESGLYPIVMLNYIF